MDRIIIRGNKALAEKLGVTEKTIGNWRRAGVLAQATLSDFGRVIIYDLDKVFECLNYKKVKPGRRAAV
ncbi:MAG: helix-turn-helix domain-containing protein [Clostridia bacterium]|nr:helix-turn-helix domain-containing protein [Clostridia bacterium]